MKIATWNVNSLRARLPNVIAWLEEAQPDVLCLQEIKTQESGFPQLELQGLGYEAQLVGQKSYNGVAILSRLPMQVTATSLPGDIDDQQARYLEAQVGGHDGVRVASIYLPNGNPVDTEKYSYKLRWMERLFAHARHLLDGEVPIVLAGDYNIIPTDDDVYEPANWRNDALFRLESRAAYRSILNLGLTDAFRIFHDEAHLYTFWDYQAGRWQRDQGLRIDHLLLSPQVADRLVACEIDKGPRGEERASDHTPIWCEIT